MLAYLLATALNAGKLEDSVGGRKIERNLLTVEILRDM